MRIKDRLLICTAPFIIIFGIGLHNNRDVSNAEVFSRRYWDFTWLLSNEIGSTLGNFLVGLTILFNKGLLGGDEIVSNVFELLGLKNLLIKLLNFWDTSPRGTPTLTILFLILTLYKLCSTFAGLCHAKNSGAGISQKKDAIMENLDHDLGKLVKKMVKSMQSEHQKKIQVHNSLGYSTNEIFGLEHSINNLSRISTAITESLYNFLSAFHVDQSEITESNEQFNLKSEMEASKLQSNIFNKHSEAYNDPVSMPSSTGELSCAVPISRSHNAIPFFQVPPTTNNEHIEDIICQEQNNDSVDNIEPLGQFNPETQSLRFSENDMTFQLKATCSVGSNTTQLKTDN
ncbi:hypothetical protein OIY81_3578, partial [Cryptosporidium canis]